MFLPSDSASVGPAEASPAANASPASDPGGGAHDHGLDLPLGYVGPALPPPLELSSPEPEPEPTGPPPATRYVTELRPFAGAKNVRVARATKTEHHLAMPCAVGKDRDLYREVRYRLRGAYGTITAELLNQGDPKATSKVQLLGAEGMLYSARLAGAPVRMKVDLAKSEYLRIRVYCTSSKSSVIFKNALVAR
jgi:hypothetical protein